MTLHARTDVIHVTVAQTGHTHSRQVDKEATAQLRKETGNKLAVVYAKDFVLTCGACEPWVEHEPQWSKTKESVPLTPDEEAAQKKDEKDGAMFQVLFAKVLRSLASEGKLG